LTIPFYVETGIGRMTRDEAIWSGPDPVSDPAYTYYKRETVEKNNGLTFANSMFASPILFKQYLYYSLTYNKMF
jgi:hypothetical protein